jgi:hypothetical protein
MEIYIIIPGDLSVGIPNLDINIDLGFDPEEEEREWIREKLVNCFSEIYNQEIDIEFYDERIEWLNKEEEIFEKRRLNNEDRR